MLCLLVEKKEEKIIEKFVMKDCIVQQLVYVKEGKVIIEPAKYNIIYEVFDLVEGKKLREHSALCDENKIIEREEISTDKVLDELTTEITATFGTSKIQSIKKYEVDKPKEVIK